MKNFVRICSILILIFIASSCSTDKVEKKKPSLKSDSFDTLPAGGDFTIHSTEQRPTRIEGRVVLRTKKGPVVKMAPMELLATDGHVVAQTSTDEKGAFVFSQVLTNGNYTIRIANPKFDGQQLILVNDRDLGSITLVVNSAK